MTDFVILDDIFVFMPRFWTRKFNRLLFLIMAATIKTHGSEGFSDSSSQPQDHLAIKKFLYHPKFFKKIPAEVWKVGKGFRNIILTAILFVVYLSWLALFKNSAEVKATVSFAILTAMGLLSIVLAVRIVFRSALEPRLQRAWTLLAISFAIYLCGSIFRFTDGQILGSESIETLVVNALYLACCPFLFAGLLHFPKAFRSKSERDRFWLNAGTVLVGVGIALWYLLVYANEDNPHRSNESVLTALYPLSNLVLLSGFAVISLRRRGSTNSFTTNFLAVALLSGFIGGVSYSYLHLRGNDLSGGYPDVFFAAALFSFAVSAFFQLREITHHETEEAESLHITNKPIRANKNAVAESARLSPFPYIGIAIGYGMLLFVAYTHRSATGGSSALSDMVVGGAVLTALIIARQVLTARENIRLHAEQVQHLTEKRFRSLVQNSSDAVLIISKDLLIRYVTPSVERVFGYSPDDIIGRKFNELVHPDDLPQALGYFKNLITRGGLSAPVEWRLRSKHGDWMFIENTGNNLFEDENVRGIVINSRNVTDRRHVEDRMLHDAFHDALTGLPNRALLLDHLRLAINRTQRHDFSRFAILFIDLDRFKYVNDSLGHHAGDLLLVEVARRIEKCLRPGDTVARLGGDEFTILVEDIVSLEEVATVAERVQQAILKPFDLDGREFVTTVSIGIALGNAEYKHAQDVLRDADTAMYHAKVGGKAQFAVFDQDMHARVISTMETEADMRRAIEREEFFMVYQPIISTTKYTLCGFEALVRWQHPTRGVIAPDDFIPLAEETGLIVPMSLWILNEVGRQCAEWRKFLPNAPLTVSVNISCKHFQQPDLVEQVARVLHETELDAGALKLEITESAMMENTERTADKLKGLRALGIELSLDDFGTGYSSLSYLHRFPLDTLKIDRSFVSRLEDDGEHFEIVRTIVALAKNLGMKTIAEGVETEKQFIKLQELNCDFAQGFFFSKPLPVATIDEMLKDMRESIF